MYQTLLSPKFLKRLLVVYLMLQASIPLILRNVTGDPTDVLIFQCGWDPAVFKATLDAWGERGVSVYHAHYYTDFFLPIAYGLLLRGLMFQVYGFTPFMWLPVIAAVADEVENVIHLSLTLNQELIFTPLFYVGLFCVYLKWSTALLSLILLIKGYFFSKRRVSSGT